MTAAATTGGCLCGDLRWRASAPPRVSALCHCRNCRVAAGAPAVGWLIFPAADFAFTAGEPQRYRTDTDAERTFCGRCGSPLTYQSDARRHEIDVTTGTADDGERYPPTADAYADERLTWVPRVDAVHPEGEGAP